MEKLIQLHDLIVRTIGHRSTKHLSHIQAMCPSKPDSLKVGREMMYEINSFYDEKEFAVWSLKRLENLDWEKEISGYQSLIKNVTFPDHVNPTLEGNFAVDQTKTPLNQKVQIRNTYHQESIPNILLDIVEHIEQLYGQSTQDSAKVAVSLLNKVYPWMQSYSTQLIKVGFNPEEASRLTFVELNRDLDEILAATELPTKFITNTGEANATALQIANDDREGLMMVSRLQERPFDNDTQQFAQELLANNATLKPSLLVLHKLLVDFAEYRLSTIPGRDKYTLIPFEEIFISKNGKLIPNIRLMKILTTNWIPSIAQVLRSNNISDPDKLESHHILQAIQSVESLHKLFQLTLFMFNQNPEEDNVRYGGHIQKVCPAKKTISIIGGELLPEIYDKIKQRS